jgi:hypothetical protein
MTPLAQDACLRMRARIPLGLAGLALGLVVLRWLVWGAIAWTSLGLLAAITVNVGPMALGWTRTRPRLARACSVLSLALVAGVLAFQSGAADWPAR